MAWLAGPRAPAFLRATIARPPQGETAGQAMNFDAMILTRCAAVPCGARDGAIRIAEVASERALAKIMAVMVRMPPERHKDAPKA
jgi:hypothetical protein